MSTLPARAGARYSVDAARRSPARLNASAVRFYVTEARVKVTGCHLILGWRTVKATGDHFNLRSRTVPLDRRSLSFAPRSRESAPATLKSALASLLQPRARTVGWWGS